MMRRLIVLLLLPALIALSSCSQDKETNMNNPPGIEIPESLRYLAIGDSYTIGEGVEENETFPALLGDSLMQRHNTVVSTDIIAKTGWSTGQLIAAIAQENPEPPYDLVTLLIGVNNQFRKLDTAEYRTEFRQLLQTAITMAGDKVERVVVLSIPDYGVTPFAENMNSDLIAQEINAFNAINFEETRKTAAGYVEVTTISRQAENDLTLLAADGLHPSAKMYKLWVDALFPVVEKMFYQ
jgi:lysophospholipase L1-like esterase